MKKVLINVEERELRVAILEEDQLVELYIEALEEKTILNNIYKGRIEGILPGLKAAFVNIGLERNAFLHFDDVRADLLWSKYREDNPTAEIPARPELALATESEEAAAVAVPVPSETGEAEEQVTTAGDEATEEASDESGDGGDFGDRRRRRRGRRGGRKRHKSDADQPFDPVRDEVLDADIDDTDEDEETPIAASEAQPAEQAGAPPAEESTGYQGGGQQSSNARSERQRRRRERWEQKKLERKMRRQQGGGGGATGGGQQGGRAPMPHPTTTAMANAWVPPEDRGAAGTRGAASPYDVFSPYSMPAQPSKRQWRRLAQQDTTNWGNQRGPFKSNPNDTRESQEDFFGPRPQQRNYVPNDNDDDEDRQPNFGSPRANEPHYSDGDEGPMPGNERFPSQNQSVGFRPRGQGQGQGQSQGDRDRRKKRGGRNRQMKRRNNQSYFAARAKKSDDADTKPVRAKRVKKEDVAELKKPTKPRKIATKATDEKPKRTRKAAEAPAKAPVEKKTSKRGPAAALPEVASKPEQKKPVRRSRKSTEAAVETTVKVPARGRKKSSEPQVETTDLRSNEAANLIEAPTASAAEPRRQERGRGRRGRRGRHSDRAEQQPAAATEQQPTEATSADTAGQGASAQSTGFVPIPIPTGPPQHRRQDRFDRQRGRDRKDQQPRRWNRPPLFTETYKKGDEVMVQVIKEEIGMKGARISTYVSLPGRYLVLLPYPNEEGGISRKVEDITERKRLKRILKEISNDETAFIIRTAGIYRDEKDIRGDVDFLSHEWKTIAQRYTDAEATALVYDDHDILYRLARDVFDDNVSEILIDSHVESEKLKSILNKLIPSLTDKVNIYSGPENIFQKYGVEKQIQKAARRKVWLKSGGYLIIDEAEALTAIDVNTGKAVGKDDQEKLILKTNTEAARAVARELKLRDIGGLIVIDFIDMKDPRNREQVLNEFKAHLRRDRSKTSVSTISEFGLVEMTRKRVRRSLRKTLFMDCPYCQGAGVVLNEQQIWLHIKHELVKTMESSKPSPSVNVTVNPRIRGYVDQNYRDAIRRLEQRYDVEIRFSMSDVFHVENYAIEKIGAPLPVISASAGGK